MQGPNARTVPMQYAPQAERNQSGRRYPVSSKARTGRPGRGARRPAVNPIPNRFDTNSGDSLPSIRGPLGRKAVMVNTYEVSTSSTSREAEISRPQPAKTRTPARQGQRNIRQHRSQHIQIADPLPEGVEVKHRLSSYFDPMAIYAPPHTEDEIVRERAKRLSSPFEAVPGCEPRSRTPSPPQPLRRTKGKGKSNALRLETQPPQHHQQWVSGKAAEGGQWSPDFMWIEANEAGLVNQAEQRRNEDLWNQRNRL